MSLEAARTFDDNVGFILAAQLACYVHTELTPSFYLLALVFSLSLDFSILFCRNSASCRETLANLKCLSFSPLLAALAFPLPSCPCRRLSGGVGGGDAVVRFHCSIGICLTLPVCAGAVSMETAGCSAGSSQRAGRLELAEGIKERAGGLEEPWKKLPV